MLLVGFKPNIAARNLPDRFQTPASYTSIYIARRHQLGFTSHIARTLRIGSSLLVARIELLGSNTLITRNHLVVFISGLARNHLISFKEDLARTPLRKDLIGFIGNVARILGLGFRFLLTTGSVPSFVGGFYSLPS